MLKPPMKEKLLLGKLDIDFTHSLIFVFLKVILLLTCFEIDLYEMADKYDIKDLMRTCVERIVPFFTSDNIKDIEVLAFFHNDDFLLQLVDSFKNKKLIPQSSSLSEANWEALAKQYVESINFEEMVKPAQENAFDFYRDF
ncbi:hypothetical protein TNIN_207521 [Trichonephila inaurata madagascariensis]|uniref:Uncharacterized protein n=1 Tax=Trichonephila inaurata madagascariensis TaxID=2747483 RepID=A0A8X6YU77_9ARAC|nr:hypothetical protein TNIN_207521 [Trichonephila inaurata madagascariensis]